MSVGRNSFLLPLLAGSSLATPARAQTAPTAKDAAPAVEDITVSTVPPEQNILPTTSTAPSEILSASGRMQEMSGDHGRAK